MVQVTVRFRDAHYNMTFEDGESIHSLKRRLHEHTGLSGNRLRLELVATDGRKFVLHDHTLLMDYREHFRGDILEVTAKDLGSQIAYNALFYIEYCFPPLSALAFYFFNKGWKSRYHRWLTGCVVFHFAKRILETKFVHIFSNPSVPFKVLIRNCMHYWVLIGLLLPVEVFHLRRMKLPAVLTRGRLSLLVLFFICELINFLCHLKLRRMRTKTDANGDTKVTLERSVPKGLLFNQIISPNYTFEILSWAAFSAFFRTWVGAGFTVLSAGIMANWALQKKKKLLQLEGLTDEEKRKVRRRWAVLPLII